MHFILLLPPGLIPDRTPGLAPDLGQDHDPGGVVILVLGLAPGAGTGSLGHVPAADPGVAGVCPEVRGTVEVGHAL